MDRLAQRIQVARRALATLRELTLLAAPTAVERDAAIQRFEYSTEACWKAAQSVLSIAFGLRFASPNPSFGHVRKTPCQPSRMPALQWIWWMTAT